MGFIQCALNWGTGTGQALFFRNEHFVLFDWTRSWTDSDNGSWKGRAISGPHRIDSAFNIPANMAYLGGDGPLDAALSADAGGSPTYANKFYFFNGANYVRYDYQDPAVRDPDTTGAISAWQLTTGFNQDVKGALNGKKTRLGYAYFFKGTQYVRYPWPDGADISASYPQDISTLGDMPEFFWGGIDATLDGDSGFADYGYMFLDDYFCRINWNTLKVDSGPRRIWDNWPGVLEILLAGDAKVVAIGWLDDTLMQLRAYIDQRSTGFPSPYDTARMELALLTHFHVAASLPDAQLMDFLGKIKERLEKILATMNRLHEVVVFHDDGEAKTYNPTYVGSDGKPHFRAYTPYDANIFLTSRFYRACDDEFNAAAVLIHEAVHFIDDQATKANDSPEWYVTGKPRIKAPKIVNGVETLVDVEYYDQLTAAAAIHNPSSYAAFAQHVESGVDKRKGKEVFRPGY